MVVEDGFGDLIELVQDHKDFEEQRDNVNNIRSQFQGVEGLG